MRGIFRSHPSARGFPYTWIAALTTRAPPRQEHSHDGDLGDAVDFGIVLGVKDGYLLSIG